jgi:RNA polymerase sigma-70 factor (ECF subfamily)
LDLDETTLIKQAAAGDAGAWEPLVLAYQEAVFRLAYLMLGDADEAEDAAQEAFMRAWDNLARFDRTRPLRPWLLRIVANLASNRRRSASRHLAALKRAGQAEASPASVEDKAAEQQRSEQLWWAVRRLELDDQHVLYLRYFLELSVTEVAQALQIAEGTVKSRSSRALERLRMIIENEFPVLGDHRSS